MVMEEEKKETSFIDRYDTVIAFLGIEFAALICFGIGGATGLSILRLVGFILCFAFIPFIMANHEKKQLIGYGIGLIPLALLIILLSLSRFWFAAYGGFSLSALLTNISVMLGFFGTFIIGYGIKQIKSLKFEYILLGILGALALFVLLTSGYTLIRYGAFYASKYKNMVYYFDGVVFSVDREMKTLNGFAFEEASLRFSMVSAFVLASILPATLYFSPKKDKLKFYFALGFGLFGLLAILLIPYLTALLLLIPIYIYGIVRKFIKIKNDKIKLIIGISTLGVFVLLVILFIFGCLKDGSFLEKLPIIGKRLQAEDGFFVRVKNAIRIAFLNRDGSINFLNVLFGASINSNGLFANNFDYSLSDSLTGLFELSILVQNGFLAFALLIAAIAFAIIWINRFLNKDKEKMGERIVPVLLLFGLFLYMSILNDEVPFVHEEGLFNPFTRGNVIMFMFFLLGLIFEGKEKVIPASRYEEVEINEI